MASSIKVRCCDECLVCSSLPLSIKEFRDLFNFVRGENPEEKKKLARMIMKCEIVRVYCIQRGRIMWFHIGGKDV